MASSSEVRAVSAPMLVVTSIALRPSAPARGGLNGHRLAGVGTDLNLELCFGAVEQFHCVEFGLAADSSDLIAQLVDFFLNG